MILETYLESLAKSPTTAGWSSLIGIITAIIGNILISFALNTQRYAHVRLEREQRQREASYTDAHNSNPAIQYGTIQNHIAESRAAKNASAPSPSRDASAARLNGSEADETDALIPSVDKPSSDSTPRPSSPKDRDDQRPHEKPSYLRSPYWWLGITLMTLGETGNFLAYGFAPASIVSPLGVVALVSNCLIAPLLLHERFRLRDGLGVLIAVGGAVTIVLSAKGSNPKLGPNEILQLIKRWEFLLYLGITLVCMAILAYLSNTKLAERTLAIDIGLVGLFGGYTALSTKGVASLLSYRLFLVFTFPITYLLVAVLVSTAILQIKYVNRALQRFDSTQVIPAQFVAFTIFVIVGSAVLYRDFESTTAVKVAQFVGGCALTFLGVWCLTSGRRGNDEDEDVEAKQLDVEEGIDLVDDEDGPAASSETTASPPTTPKPRHSRSISTDSPASFATASSSFTPLKPSNSASAQRTPFLTTTASSPVLPTSAQAHPQSPSSSPTRQARRHSQQQPQTPTRPSAVTQTRSYAPSSSRIQESPNSNAMSMSMSTSLSTSNNTGGRNTIPRFPTPGPFTSPLSSGLSVVVADQRGRLSRGGSTRSIAAAPPMSGAAAGGGSVIATERPRLGRGATVEVAKATPESSTRDGRDGRGGEGGTGGGGGGGR